MQKRKECPCGLGKTGLVPQNPKSSTLSSGSDVPLIKLARKVIRPVALDPAVVGEQAGAIPYRIVDGQVVFLMITSRRSANWVFPKGSIEKGQAPTDTAAQEAFEEAGVRGEIAEEPVGAYLHPRNDEEESMVRVLLFPMLVTEQFDVWPEEPQRFRHWALLPQVRSLMASRKAARIAAEFSRKVLSGS